MVGMFTGFLKENALFLVLLLALAGGYLWLRQGPSNVASAAEFDALLTGGKPLLVEFYSDTWSACLLAKPAVDGIEREMQGQAVVVRLNVFDEAGRSVASRYGLSAVPTFLVFSGGEDPVLRFVGRPDSEKIIQALRGQQ